LLGALNELFYPLLWLPLEGLVLGLAFGYVAARRLTRRLDAIAQASQQWEEGDFHRRAPERPKDELGMLGEQLNQMAAKLQQQIALQQQLAAIEERNRLARDLHDTVKQQLFACAMQISAAQRVLAHSPEAARKYLDESAALAGQMQQELSAVIQELLPLPQSLLNSLRSLIAEWTRQTGIAVESQNLEALPAEASAALNLALMRITQEALANVARHSRATHVTVQGRRNHLTASLTICDNGQGFDPATVVAGLGLQSMRRRAMALPGGRFELRSVPGGGVCIEILFQPEATENQNES
ncbi:MAG TPA: histidine kinase, partial [Blastocatellia bacterium]|nr:histidine kinase [Blastocatellia bacterium]